MGARRAVGWAPRFVPGSASGQCCHMQVTQGERVDAG